MDEQVALLLIQEDYDDSKWEIVADKVDDGHSKHDATSYYSVFNRLSDNTYWMVSFTISYSYGLDEHSVYALQVKKEEVVRTEWVIVNEH
tara:strand:+ start:675 stop:944 length:270 start_codon:yes stop_codon:yes gene_type:complete